MSVVVADLVAEGGPRPGVLAAAVEMTLGNNGSRWMIGLAAPSLR